jgi:hypothetical protein
MSTALAGFLGALLGASASLLGLVIQQHYQTKRERIKIAADLGLSEYKSGLEIFLKRGGVTLPPVSLYVIYHARLLEEMAKGKINKERIETLNNEYEELFKKLQKPKES